MKQPLKNILIISKKGVAEAQALGRTMQAFFEQHAVQACVVENSHQDSDALHACARQANLVCVIGGDGTIVSVARKLVPLNVPFIGINMGAVGFLAQTTVTEWQQCFLDVLQGFDVTEHLALEYTIDGVTGTAINDIVVSRGAVARVVPLKLYVDGAYVATVRSDGLIFSTPLGSTGYSSSAGGPLLHPGLSVICITAISPMYHGFQPLLLSADSSIEIEAVLSTADVFITVDGQDNHVLPIGKRLKIQRSPYKMQFVAGLEAGYFSQLVQKGFIKA